jgi:hypothetical protein
MKENKSTFDFLAKIAQAGEACREAQIQFRVARLECQFLDVEKGTRLKLEWSTQDGVLYWEERQDGQADVEPAFFRISLRTTDIARCTEALGAWAPRAWDQTGRSFVACFKSSLPSPPKPRENAAEAVASATSDESPSEDVTP